MEIGSLTTSAFIVNVAVGKKKRKKKLVLVIRDGVIAFYSF